MNKHSDKTSDKDTLDFLMIKKTQDSKAEEDKKRKERARARQELETRFGSRTHKCKRIINNTKTRINKQRQKIQQKHKKKISSYKSKTKAKAKKMNDKQKDPKKYNIPRELDRYTDIKVFSSNEEITPEDMKPPVIIGEDVVLTEEEEEVLKLGPKFTLRRVLDRETFLVEVEKALAKERYGKINEEDEVGEPLGLKDDKEDNDKIREEEEWQETKSSLIFDKEDNNVNFSRTRATNMKNNKRIHLPRPLPPSQEAMMELRKIEALKIYDACMKLLENER